LLGAPSTIAGAPNTLMNGQNYPWLILNKKRDPHLAPHILPHLLACSSSSVASPLSSSLFSSSARPFPPAFRYTFSGVEVSFLFLLSNCFFL